MSSNAQLNVSADYSQKVEFLKSKITSIQDYPKPGILFRDITTLCEDGKAFSMVIDMFYEQFKDLKVDKIVSAEARGFVFGAPVAARLGVGFVMVRKPHKLPRKTVSQTYDLEYGSNELQMHADSLKPGERVVIIDDLLATGGTVIAMAELVKKLQAQVVGAGFVINLVDLGGYAKIKDSCNVDSVCLLDFPGH